MNKYKALPWQVFFASTIAIIIAIHYGLCTQDDAFISFRYSENLALGNGLVFNLGERVEGFSNPSWTLLFALIIKLGFDPIIPSLFIGYLSITFLTYATARLAKQMGGVIWISCWLVALDPSMILESVQGLESVFYAGLLPLACAQLLEEREANRPYRRSTFLFGLACFTRPEAPLFFVLAHGSLLLKDRALKKSVLATLPIVLLLASMTIFRIVYYDDILPNTFYAKVSGSGALLRGLEYCFTHLRHHPLMWLGLFFVFKNIRDTKWFMLLSVFGIYLLYVIWIGGDFKPTSRFILPVGGLMAVAASILLQNLLQRKRIWIGLVLLFVMLFGRTTLFEKTEAWALERRQNFLARKFLGEWLEAHTSEFDVIAMHSIGAVPYYANRRTIDMWGLTDRTIAKTPVKDIGAGLAGHEKSNPEYVFSLEPDIYLPEYKFFRPEKYTQVPEAGFPEDFAQNYEAVSIPLEGSWLNIWVKRGYRFRVGGR